MSGQNLDRQICALTEARLLERMEIGEAAELLDKWGSQSSQDSSRQAAELLRPVVGSTGDQRIPGCDSPRSSVPMSGMMLNVWPRRRPSPELMTVRRK
jgi:hypothetical protein